LWPFGERERKKCIAINHKDYFTNTGTFLTSKQFLPEIMFTPKVSKKQIYDTDFRFKLCILLFMVVKKMTMKNKK
jgi:hypothetical protein